MKFNLDKDLLLNVINKLGRILTSNNSSIPILNGVLIQATETFIAFTASNGVESILIREVVNNEGIEVLEPGAAVLPREVFNLTKKLKAGIIKFTTNEDCTQINLMQKKTKLDFSIELADQYPSIATNQQKIGQFKLSAKEFEEIVRVTAFAVSKKDSRPVLQGMNFSLGSGDNGLAYKVVATDSHRLAQISSKNTLNETVNFTVPAQSLTQAMKSFELEGDVTIVTYKTQIALVNGNTILYTRLLEGNYPETNRLIPETQGFLILNRDELVDALELIKAMAEKPNAFLTLSKGNILLESKVESSHARAQQEIQIITNEGIEEDFKITFSVEYTLEALRTIRTKQLRMELNGTLRPFILKNVYEADSSTTPNELQLILPVRTY